MIKSGLFYVFCLELETKIARFIGLRGTANNTYQQSSNFVRLKNRPRTANSTKVTSALDELCKVILTKLREHRAHLIIYTQKNVSLGTIIDAKIFAYLYSKNFEKTDLTNLEPFRKL